MRAVVEAIEGEYERYKAYGEGVMDQLDAEQLIQRPSPESLSIAMIVWHLGGNLKSRFTDFLTTDGEKPWRDREDEFAPRSPTPRELRAKWEDGWQAVLSAVGDLDDAALERTITIRGVELSVARALHRSLAHTSYHVGQMSYVGKLLRGPEWSYLSIPPGGTASYNRDPKLEKGFGAK